MYCVFFSVFCHGYDIRSPPDTNECTNKCTNK